MISADTPTKLNGPIDRRVSAARKQSIHSVMVRYVLEHRPYQSATNKQEDQRVANQLAATVKGIEGKMSGEATALKWRNPMSFLQVAEIAVEYLAWQLEYRSGMDWREVTEEWGNGHLGKFEEQVAISAGVDKLW